MARSRERELPEPVQVGAVALRHGQVRLDARELRLIAVD